MEPEQSARLEYIPEHLAVGVAILGCANMHIRYVNQYLRSLLEEPWRTQNVTGHAFEEIAPPELQKIALPLLWEACGTREKIRRTDVPYEGFLATRGRTYWNVTIERVSFDEPSLNEQEQQEQSEALLLTLEEVTELARSRVYLNAIQYISSAISGPHALPLVLDRILQSVQNLVGSTRCAVLLLDTSVSGYETHGLGIGGYRQGETQAVKPPTVVIAAQKGVHLRSQDWRPLLSEQVLLGRVMREGRTLVIEDSSTVPEISFPLLDDEGTPRRPGSVLCVPIFEPQTNEHGGKGSIFNTLTAATRSRAVIGTIEVYHRRARGFPAEEVVLLEQFAQQAGLAIQHARLFRRINRLARDATRSARQQKNVMQAIPDGVIIYDHRWRVADINQTIRKLLGWNDSIIGLPIAEALSRSTAVFESDFRLIPNLITELDRRAMNRQIDEFKLIGADGQHYVIRRSYAPIHDELGNVFAFIVIYHDVTEQARIRERIEAEVVERTSELAQRNEALQLAKAAQELESARMELLLERLPSGVLLISASDRRMTLINHRAAQLLQRLGLSGIENSGNADTIANESNDASIEEMFRSFTVYGNAGTVVPYEEQPLFLALHEGQASEAELHLTEQDGQPLYLLMSAAALRDADGTISSAVLVLHEITRLKTLERAREDFFTTMAHELKTPLANIRAHLSALQASDYQWSPAEQHNFLQTADEQVERLVRMINHFLDASRVEAGALRLELEPILLPEMVEDLQERLEALIQASKRRLEVRLSPHLPAVLGDYELIMSVLTNLLSNAFRYAPEGDAVQLEIEGIRNGNSDGTGNTGNTNNDSGNPPFTSVELRVIDRGPGLSLQQQNELFTRFSTFAAMRRPEADSPGQPEAERRKTNTRWSPASGLGLYISRGIVEAHGSTLSLQSVPGEGATFRFTLAVASAVPGKVEVG